MHNGDCRGPPSKTAARIIPVILDAQRTITQNMIQKEKRRRVEYLCGKNTKNKKQNDNNNHNKKLRGIVIHTIILGEIAIKNSRWRVCFY